MENKNLINRKCILIINDDNSKKYIIPKELKSQYNKKYYNSKKENILNGLRQKVYCKTCDIFINKSYYNKHLTTKTHLKKLN